MKTLILSAVLATSMTLSSCANFDPNSVKPLVNAVVLVAANKYAQKDPDNAGKILDLATALEIAASITDNTLTKEQFVAMVQKVDVEWAILGVALFDIYSQNVIVPEKYAAHAETLKSLAQTLRDSLLLVIVEK